MDPVKILVIFSVTLAIQGSSMAAVYNVGDSDGWNTGVNYDKWAADKTFHVGDSIVFHYAPPSHNVQQVNGEDYSSCAATSSIAFYNSGNDRVTLDSAGDYHFICNIPKQCETGMHVHIKVKDDKEREHRGKTNPNPPPAAGGQGPPSSFTPSSIPTGDLYPVDRNFSYDDAAGGLTTNKVGGLICMAALYFFM